MAGRIFVAQSPNTSAGHRFFTVAGQGVDSLRAAEICGVISEAGNKTGKGWIALVQETAQTNAGSVRIGLTKVILHGLEADKLSDEEIGAIKEGLAVSMEHLEAYVATLGPDQLKSSTVCEVPKNVVWDHRFGQAMKIESSRVTQRESAKTPINKPAHPLARTFWSLSMFIILFSVVGSLVLFKPNLLTPTIRQSETPDKHMHSPDFEPDASNVAPSRINDLWPTTHRIAPGYEDRDFESKFSLERIATLTCLSATDLEEIIYTNIQVLNDSNRDFLNTPWSWIEKSARFYRATFKNNHTFSGSERFITAEALCRWFEEPVVVEITSDDQVLLNLIGTIAASTARLNGDTPWAAKEQMGVGDGVLRYEFEFDAESKGQFLVRHQPVEFRIYGYIQGHLPETPATNRKSLVFPASKPGIAAMDAVSAPQNEGSGHFLSPARTYCEIRFIPFNSAWPTEPLPLTGVGELLNSNSWIEFKGLSPPSFIE